VKLTKSSNGFKILTCHSQYLKVANTDDGTALSLGTNQRQGTTLYFYSTFDETTASGSNAFISTSKTATATDAYFVTTSIDDALVSATTTSATYSVADYGEWALYAVSTTAKQEEKKGEETITDATPLFDPTVVNYTVSSSNVTSITDGYYVIKSGAGEYYIQESDGALVPTGTVDENCVVYVSTKLDADSNTCYTIQSYSGHYYQQMTTADTMKAMKISNTAGYYYVMNDSMKNTRPRPGYFYLGISMPIMVVLYDER